MFFSLRMRYKVLLLRNSLRYPIQTSMMIIYMIKRELNTKDPYIINLPVGIVKDEDFISETYFDLCIKRQKTKTQIFLIPDIDGCRTVFHHFAPDIKFSAAFLHYSTNNIDAADIISETTDHLINVRNYINNFVLY